jgi:ABC-type nitrate/sulfonate/bicarbonate transport system substrate-binding protein
MTYDNDSLEGWDDLVGERVGILSPPSGMWNQTNLMLREMGYSTDDFDFRKGSPGAIHSFDQRGDVTAHVHFVPVSIKSIVSGEMREVQFLPSKFEELFGHNLQFVPLAAHQSWIDENPDAAQSLRATLIEAQQLFMDSPRETISAYSDAIGLENEDQVDAAVERMPPTYPAEWGDTQKENVTSQLELSKEYGIIPEDAPTDIVADI